MAFVIDRSAALAWLLPDKRLRAADALADRLEAETPVAPVLWPLEVANALLTARRPARLTDRDVDRLLEVFGALPVVDDHARQLGRSVHHGLRGNPSASARVRAEWIATPPTTWP